MQVSKRIPISERVNTTEINDETLSLDRQKPADV